MAVVTTDNDSATSSRRRTPAWRPLARSLTPAAAILAVQLVLFPLSAGLWLRGLIVGGLTALIAPTALISLVGLYNKLGYKEDAAETCGYLRRFHPGAPQTDEVCPQAQ